MYTRYNVRGYKAGREVEKKRKLEWDLVKERNLKWDQDKIRKIMSVSSDC